MLLSAVSELYVLPHEVLRRELAQCEEGGAERALDADGVGGAQQRPDGDDQRPDVALLGQLDVGHALPHQSRGQRRVEVQALPDRCPNDHFRLQCQRRKIFLLKIENACVCLPVGLVTFSEARRTCQWDHETSPAGALSTCARQASCLFPNFLLLLCGSSGIPGLSLEKTNLRQETSRQRASGHPAPSTPCPSPPISAPWC